MDAITLAVVGDGACGKARLLDVFTYDEFSPEYASTALVEYKTEIRVDEELVNLTMWHLPGQTDFNRLNEHFANNTDVDIFLICFSVDNPASLENTKFKWHPFAKNVPFLLIANQIDLRTDPSTIRELAKSKQHVVSSEEGKSMAEEIGAWWYLECSAWTRQGVKEVFEAAVRVVLGEKRTIMEHPYDDPISVSSIQRLEEMAGIELLTPLAETRFQILRAAGVLLNKSEQKKLLERDNIQALEYAIKKWKSLKHRHTPTWRSLLLILDILKETALSQMVKTYLGKIDYLSTYNEVIATRVCFEMWFIKVILLGAPRLGKTTARRRLTGEIDDIKSSGEGVQPSTGAVESAPSIVVRNLSSTTALVTPTEWVASKDLTDEARMLIQFFYSHVQEKQGSASASAVDFRSTDLSSTPPKSETGGKSKSKGNRFFKRKAKKAPIKIPTPTEQVNKHQAQALAEVAELFRNAVDPKYWNDVKHLFKNSAFLKMEDTGGQPEFMDMLPALTIGPALYLLFCKLTDDLKSHYTVTYLSPSGESTTPEESTYTMEEVLLTVLASISCFKSYSSAPQFGSDKINSSSNAEDLLASCKSSLAYIVGTHKDQVSEQQIDEFDEKLQQSIRSTDFFRDGLVQFSSENRMVLPIDNMNGGQSEIKKVQKFLEDGMKQHFKKLLIPAAWLILSLCLRKREERTASLQSVLQLAAELGISEEEAKSALQFLYHYAGVLMYFPQLEVLKDMVICDTQVVYDSATNLIVNTFKFGQVSRAASERFRKTGQFSLKDIRGATENVSGDFIPIHKLVKLLEHLNIIAPIVEPNPQHSSLKPEIAYFMPCVLQNATHAELDKWWSANSTQQPYPAPLFIRYKCGYVPIGVFPAMIASLADQRSAHMIYEGIKKNHVQFRFGSDFDMVTLISHPRYYAIHITRMSDPRTPVHEICSQVRDLIESTLMTVTAHMNYSFTIEYQMSFECTSHPGREHLCVVENEDSTTRFMLCLENTDNRQPVEMQHQHLVWLKKVCSKTATFTEDTYSQRHPFTRSSSSSKPIPSSCKTASSEIVRITEGEFSRASEILKQYSHKWRAIGESLGFKASELDNITSRPPLFSDAPNSWLYAMLSEWQLWAPGDHRGSNNYATLHSLRMAVDKAGLGLTAQELD